MHLINIDWTCAASDRLSDLSSCASHHRVPSPAGTMVASLVLISHAHLMFECHACLVSCKQVEHVLQFHVTPCDRSLPKSSKHYPAVGLDLVKPSSELFLAWNAMRK